MYLLKNRFFSFGRTVAKIFSTITHSSVFYKGYKFLGLGLKNLAILSLLKLSLRTNSKILGTPIFRKFFLIFSHRAHVILRFRAL
ncbi:hypothetical protein LEP1GSC016_1320 [Leptospira borgpetersenii serovar Hardjo-bovis str. Sponselee]|uniref:Uncharacterized protein n=1 Tax=Leptospira borgpetersenii serovar Hardjo-bovis str. Sponselee TaxID=1303729 RepID=M6CAG3_LEPBO|nr:hypothetical protein LBHB_13840 [Leptospira borgpetersenii serovar Hardjo]EMJ83245.1 hypothetical protein LEP1GSC016_1320 [Leptospira borgpetersenii serovar Hardjo-bovis str. Sponselee]